jgi:hypothetical protein
MPLSQKTFPSGSSRNQESSKSSPPHITGTTRPNPETSIPRKTELCVYLRRDHSHQYDADDHRHTRSRYHSTLPRLVARQAGDQSSSPISSSTLRCSTPISGLRSSRFRLLLAKRRILLRSWRRIGTVSSSLLSSTGDQGEFLVVLQRV